VQVAVVVNVGVAHAAAGANVTTANPAVGSGGSAVVAPAISTGTAKAVGQVARTAIVQRAVVTGGDDGTQSTTVVNAGVAVANTGLNVASGGGATAAARASVTAGRAIAIGNNSRTAVVQDAVARGRDDGTLTIEQRAVVVNVGLAVANTGGNVAIGPASEHLPTSGGMAAALWALLAPLFQTPPMPGSADAGAAGASAISTGTAVATGNRSTTSVVQSAAGTVAGRGAATARQSVAVGNVGVAIANTGLNGVLASGPRGDTSGLASFLAPLTTLDWLHGPNPFAAMTAQLDVDGLLFELEGRFSGRELTGTGAHVRQISAVIDVSIATADRSTTTVRGRAHGAIVSVPMLRTGNATATNRSDATVCQTLDDDGACRRLLPRPAPPAPASRPRSQSQSRSVGNEQAAVMSTADTPPNAIATSHSIVTVTSTRETGPAAETLPATGGEARTLLTIGIALLAMGESLRRASKARQGVRRAR
jgi:hypothetical protein